MWGGIWVGTGRGSPAIAAAWPRLESLGLSVQGGVAFGVMTALIMLMPTYPALLAVLLLFGITNAGFDVAMNAQAATVEANHHKPIISSLHGMFSLGGMAGAAVGGVLLTTGVILLLAAPSPERSTRARVGFQLAPGAFSVTLGGAL